MYTWRIRVYARWVPRGTASTHEHRLATADHASDRRENMAEAPNSTAPSAPPAAESSSSAPALLTAPNMPRAGKGGGDKARNKRKAAPVHVHVREGEAWACDTCLNPHSRHVSQSVCRRTSQGVRTQHRGECIRVLYASPAAQVYTSNTYFPPRVSTRY